MEYLEEKTPQEIAEKLIELAKDLDFADYEETMEETTKELEDAIYQLKAMAQNKYNNDYWRTFYKVLQSI